MQEAAEPTIISSFPWSQVTKVASHKIFSSLKKKEERERDRDYVKTKSEIVSVRVFMRQCVMCDE